MRGLDGLRASVAGRPDRGRRASDRGARGVPFLLDAESLLRAPHLYVKELPVARDRWPSRQPCCVSGSSRSGLPRCAGSDHGVGDGEKPPHGCHHGDLRRFALVAQPLIEDTGRAIASDAGDDAHVQRGNVDKNDVARACREWRTILRLCRPAWSKRSRRLPRSETSGDSRLRRGE